MRLFVTGGTGYLGRAVARAVAEAGHQVVGLARSGEARATLEAAGHDVVDGGLTDLDLLRRCASNTDGTLHLAMDHGADAGEVDARAVGALLEGLAGDGKPFVYTSGVWVLGDTGGFGAVEDAPLRPAPHVAWRPAVERSVLDASGRGVSSVVVRPGLVYGEGGGIPDMLVQEARDRGVPRVVGDGRQLWPFVHLHDLGDLYVRMLHAEPGTLFHAVDGPSVRALDVALAACVAAGREPAVETWPVEEARQEMGPWVDGLAFSQEVRGERARERLGWRPAGPSILEDLMTGSYRAG